MINVQWINTRHYLSEAKNTSGIPPSVPLACAQSLSPVQLFATPWTVVLQAPLSMGLSKQEYWSGLLFPSPGDLTNPGMESPFLVSPALAGGFFTTEPPGKPLYKSTIFQYKIIIFKGKVQMGVFQKLTHLADKSCAKYLLYKTYTKTIFQKETKMVHSVNFH